MFPWILIEENGGFQCEISFCAVFNFREGSHKFNWPDSVANWGHVAGCLGAALMGRPGETLEAWILGNYGDRICEV